MKRRGLVASVILGMGVGVGGSDTGVWGMENGAGGAGNGLLLKK